MDTYHSKYGLRWDEITDEELYVIDLLQHSDGRRSTRIRRVSDQKQKSAVLSTKQYKGLDLTRWQRELSLTQHVELTTGGGFVEEAHGGWLTDAEFEWWRGPRDTEPEWFDGVPPLFPPK